MCIEDLLKKGIVELKDINEAFFKAKILLCNILGVDKEYLVIHNSDEVCGELSEKYFDGINRLKNGEPIQYIIGKTEFYGLEFFVNDSVLIPQPDTEILVEEILKNYSSKKIVLDLCTGSGAIAIVLKSKMNDMKLFASDISEEALKIARENAKKNNVEITFIKSNLFEKIYNKFDVIVSNPPYIETDILDKLPEEVRYEPALALDGGKDGLDFYRKIIKEAKRYLKENGVLAFEIGFNQKYNVMKLLENENYKEIYCKKDYGGNDRIVVARK